MISVLYVEDDTSLLEIGKFLLEKDGSIEVDTCSSVHDAHLKLGDKRYDIIISDYAMPVMNGIKFLQSLRSGGDKTPFFFFAGKGRKSVIIDALNLGADFYLEKAGNAKLQFEVLLEEIKRTVEQKSTATEPEHPAGILQSLLESVAEGVLIVDPAGKITTINQNFLSLFKIPGELTGKGTDSSILLQYVLDQLDDTADFSGKITKSIKDPGITCQGTMHLKDGQAVAWSSLAKKTGDTISGRIWIFRDISDQTRTGHQLTMLKEQLRTAEETLHHQRNELERKEEMIQECKGMMNILTRSTPGGILASREGIIIEANEQCAGMLGYSSAELAGLSLPGFFSPETGGEIMESLRSGSVGKYELVALHRNGSSFNAEVTGYTAGFPEDTILVLMIRSVSGDTIALPREKSPDNEDIPAETGSDEADHEHIPEYKQGGEIQPEHDSGVPAPAGIPIQGPASISLLWEVDDVHPSEDAGKMPPSPDNDHPSRISEIDDLIEPDASRNPPTHPWYNPDLRPWFSEIRRLKRRFF